MYFELILKTTIRPCDPNLVRMYVCGPTVYNSAHMGHARAALTFDIIRRILEGERLPLTSLVTYAQVILTTRSCIRLTLLTLTTRLYLPQGRLSC
jgi:hypothetical protein